MLGCAHFQLENCVTASRNTHFKNQAIHVIFGADLAASTDPTIVSHLVHYVTMNMRMTEPRHTDM